MNGDTTRLMAADGHELAAYEVRPDGARAAIVIVQEIFGVNAHIRSVVDRYASLGYHTVAPALFDRIQPGVELGYDGPGVERGRDLAERIKWEPAMADLAAAVAHVAATGPVGVIGYCFGGSLAWRAAAELPVDAAVGYYGGQIHELVDLRPVASTMLHFGEIDHGIPMGEVAVVAGAHPDVIVHVYERAQHGFNCDARASYDPISATIALGRTVEFLDIHGVRP